MKTFMDKVEHVIEHTGTNATTTVTFEKCASGKIGMNVLTERYSSGRSMYSSDPLVRLVLSKEQLLGLRTAIGKALLLMESK